MSNKDIPVESTTNYNVLGYWGGFEIIDIVPYTNTRGEVTDKYVIGFAPIDKGDGTSFTPRDLVISAHDKENAITKEPIDLAELRSRRLDPVAKEILELFKKNDIFISRGEGIAEDVTYIFQTVINSMNNWRKVVEDCMWGYSEDLLKFHMLEEKFEKYKDTVLPNLRKKSDHTK